MNKKQFCSALEDLGLEYKRQDQNNAAAQTLGCSWRTIARYAARGCYDEPTARLLRTLHILHDTSRTAFTRVMERL